MMQLQSSWKIGAVILVSLLLILYLFVHCWLWEIKCWLGMYLFNVSNKLWNMCKVNDKNFETKSNFEHISHLLLVFLLLMLNKSMLAGNNFYYKKINVWEKALRILGSSLWEKLTFSEIANCKLLQYFTYRR